MVEQKCWGTTEEVIWSPVMSVHRCEVNRGGYCSWHHHRHRVNLFICETADIVVQYTLVPGDQPVIHHIPPGHTYQILPTMDHRFIVLGSGLLWEVYWPLPGRPFERDDIVRYDTGSVLPDPDISLHRWIPIGGLLT